MALILPSPEMQIRIRKMLNEDVNTRNRDLEAIKEWLQRQPHLPDTWDDRRIMSFLILRFSRFSLEKCKRRLDMYFTVKNAIPEVFTNRNITGTELKRVANLWHIAILPGLTSKGERFSIGRSHNMQYDTSHVINIFKYLTMMADVRIEAEKFGITGEQYIIVISGLTIPQVIGTSPIIVKKFIICLQEAYPLLIKGIHIVNPTSLIDFALKLINSFLKEKIRERIHVHSNLKSLHKFIPKSMLPEEYGGSAGKFDDLCGKFHVFKLVSEFTVCRVEDCSTWFKEQDGLKPMNRNVQENRPITMNSSASVVVLDS